MFLAGHTVAMVTKRGLVHNHSYENEFNLHVNEISFSYEKMGTKTRFEEEAKGNSEMACCSPMIGQFFDTMIVASSDAEWL